MARILLVLAVDWPERVDGTVLTARHLARCYQSLGHDVVRFSRSFQPADAAGATTSPSPRADDGETQIVHAPAEEGYEETIDHPRVVAAFTALLASFRPDAVHIHHLEHLSVRLPQAAAATGVPVVMTLHDFYLACPAVQLMTNFRRLCSGPAQGRRCAHCHPAMATVVPATRHPPLQRRVRRLVGACTGQHRRAFALRYQRMQEALDAPITFAAPSQYLADALPRALDRPMAIRVVPNGCDLTWSPRPCRTGAAPVIAYMGTIAQVKGVHLIAQALQSLAHLPWRLELHGPGTPAYLARCTAPLPAARVRVAGAYAPETAAAILAQVDVLVMPSLWPENCPLVLLQALAAGVPCIVPGWGGMAELVDPRAGGRWFTPGNVPELRRVLEDLLTAPRTIVELNQQLASRPRRSWGTVAQEYLGLLRLAAPADPTAAG